MGYKGLKELLGSDSFFVDGPGERNGAHRLAAVSSLIAAAMANRSISCDKRAGIPYGLQRIEGVAEK